MTIKKRDSNIELLRIVLMLMIILLHLIVHGRGLSFLGTSVSLEQPSVLSMLLINSFLIVAVDTYIFISAFYGIKFSTRGLVSFVLQGTFYSSLIYIIASQTGWDAWTLPNFYRSLIPILSGKWWFLSGYVLLFILSPILNAGIRSINQKQHLFISIALLVISASFFITNFSPDSLRVNSSTIGLFITIYICGSYIKRYSIKVDKPLILYIASSLILFSLVFTYSKFVSNASAWSIFGYMNPLIIFSSICLFFAFKKINIQSKLINQISTLTFGIYLLHDAEPVRRFLTHHVQQIQVENTGLLILILIALAIGIFIVCAFVEKLRQMLFSPIVDRIMKTKVLEKFNSL